MLYRGWNSDLLTVPNAASRSDEADPLIWRLCRKIIETGGTVRVTDEQIHVHFQKRAHNPILRQAGLDAKAGAIPWAGGRTLRFTYAGTS
jgi:hypothetical protein